jgi:hypothetical protein
MTDLVTMRYFIRFNPSANSYSVFDRTICNPFGRSYCVLPLVTRHEAERWMATHSY